MLALAITDLEAIARLADVTAAMSVEALLGTDRAFAADLQALRPQVGQAVERGQPAPAARRFGDRGEPPRGRSAGAGRLLVAVHAAGARRRARHHRPRPHDRRARARRGDRQPDDPARRAGRVVRQLPRRTARLRVRLPRDRGVGALGDQRTPHRPAPRRHPLARPAAVPRTRSWRQLGADDRPLHAGRDGDREQAPRRARQRRLVADERDAGGPRVDGVVGGAQAATVGRQPAPGAGSRARVRGACDRPAGATRTGRRHGIRGRRAARAGRTAPDRIDGCRPSSGRPRT